MSRKFIASQNVVSSMLESIEKMNMVSGAIENEKVRYKIDKCLDRLYMLVREGKDIEEANPYD